MPGLEFQLGMCVRVFVHVCVRVSVHACAWVHTCVNVCMCQERVQI